MTVYICNMPTLHSDLSEKGEDIVCAPRNRGIVETKII